MLLQQMRQMCYKAAHLHEELPDLPHVAAVCVYPAMVPVARKEVEGTGIYVASVATAFPSGQSDRQLKLQETRIAVDNGADEIDMVISRGAFLRGERNSKDVPQAVHYQKQLTKLITHYRASWHKMSGGHVAKDFPFQFTQLPSWNPPQTKPVEGLEASLSTLSMDSRLAAQLASNTAMAVTIDTGDAIELHPKNKKPIGLRHAYLALKQTYGHKIPAKGPMFERQTIKENQIVLKFSETGKGLMTGRSGDLNSFAIAAQTGQWHWAKAKIKGESVIVSATDVIKPVAVRYAWGMNPSQRNLLYNHEGFPASPFRTDDWPLSNLGVRPQI